MRYPAGCPFIGEAEVAAVISTLRSGWITQGPRVREFEARLAEFLGVKHVVACASGTAALHLALSSLGIGPGDEVLVPDLTYVATANAVAYVGAQPVLVDVESRTWGIDLRDDAVTERTQAVIVTHLYGIPSDMNAVFEFAKRHNLLVIEDASEALGVGWEGMACGSLGICGTFSFYGNKVITTGEGGAVVTDNDSLAETMRFLRNQAQSPVRRFWHSEVGYNYRMSDINAALGIAQLERIDEFLAERRRVVETYLEMLDNVVASRMTRFTAPWLFTGLLPVDVRYDVVEARLAERGVETRPVFVPMHRLPMYAASEELFPVAIELSDGGISLPTYPSLTRDDLIYITDAVKEAVGESCIPLEPAHTTT